MATKSFLKNINIKSVAAARRLVKALEKAEGKRGQTVEMSRAVEEVRPNQVKDFAAKIEW